jgi:hypothetical protein
MSPEHEALLKRNAQAEAEWHAWRGPFIVRAALMFDVPANEVTLAQYAAAIERTQQDTMPVALKGER